MNLQLSDGTTLQIPDDASEEMIRNYAARGEAHIKANPRQPTQEPSDPYSALNTAGRVASNATLGALDFANWATRRVFNPGSMLTDKLGMTQAPPELAPMARQATGIEELPADASYARQIGEGVAAAAPFGLVGGVRGVMAAPTWSAAARNAANAIYQTIAPVVAGDAGARLGGAIGGEEGARIGGLVGGTAAAAAPSAVGTTARMRYAGRGNPDAPDIWAAAERTNVEPTAGMLGDANIQTRERQYIAQRPEGRSSTMRNEAQQRMYDVVDEAGRVRGGTGQGPAVVGETIRDVAGGALQNAETASSTAQQGLIDRIGPRAPTDVTPLLANMENIRTRTDPASYRPIEQRINDLRLMLEQTHGSPPGATTLPYERVKDFRTSVGRRMQGMDPVPGRFAGDIYESTTGAMQDAAARRGVTRAEFDAAMAPTRALEGPGGVREVLGGLAEAEPSAAYSRMLPGGARNPERVQNLVRLAQGDPRLESIFGNYIQLLNEKTLGAQGRGASQGPANFARTVDPANMDPTFLDTVAGPQAPVLRDVATLAGSHTYPSSGTGLHRAVGGITNGAFARYGLGEVGAAIGSVLGPAGSNIGRAIGAIGIPNLTRMLGEYMLQHPEARRAMAGAPSAQPPMSITDLIAQLQAVSAAQSNAGYRDGSYR